MLLNKEKILLHIRIIDSNRSKTAKAIGVSRQTFHHYLTAAKNIKYNTLIKLQVYLRFKNLEDMFSEGSDREKI